MNHAFLTAATVVLLIASANAAAAKSELTLNAERRVVHAGGVVRFTGFAGDDAGIRQAVYCLRVSAGVSAGAWEGEERRRPAGSCVSPYRAGSWSAEFQTDVRFPFPGRFVVRAVGVDARTLREIYGPSPAVAVLVR